MRTGQQLLFPDPKPLVERLGLEFFRQAPQAPGVYVMRDPAGAVLYIGKAKDLRKRLNSYRVANSDRMRRRQLRLLNMVAQIETRLCENEAGALRLEAELLQTLKPRFNRAGTWSPPLRFLSWRIDDSALEMIVTTQFESGWEMHCPLRGGAAALRVALLRLLWRAMHRSASLDSAPAGWSRGAIEPVGCLRPSPGDPEFLAEARHWMGQFLAAGPEPLSGWVLRRLPPPPSLFDRTLLECDLVTLTDLGSHLTIQQLNQANC